MVKSGDIDDNKHVISMLRKHHFRPNLLREKKFLNYEKVSSAKVNLNYPYLSPMNAWIGPSNADDSER